MSAPPPPPRQPPAVPPPPLLPSPKVATKPVIVQQKCPISLDLLQRLLPSGAELSPNGGVRLLEQQGVVSRLYLLDLVYKNQDDDNIRQMIAKIHLARGGNAAMRKASYAREVAAYQHILPRLSPRISPQILVIEWNEQKGELLMLMEFLDAKRGRFGVNDVPFSSLDELRSILHEWK